MESTKAFMNAFGRRFNLGSTGGRDITGFIIGFLGVGEVIQFDIVVSKFVIPPW